MQILIRRPFLHRFDVYRTIFEFAECDRQLQGLRGGRFNEIRRSFKRQAISISARHCRWQRALSTEYDVGEIAHTAWRLIQTTNLHRRRAQHERRQTSFVSFDDDILRGLFQTIGKFIMSLAALSIEFNSPFQLQVPAETKAGLGNGGAEERT